MHRFVIYNVDDGPVPLSVPVSQYEQYKSRVLGLEHLNGKQPILMLLITLVFVFLAKMSAIKTCIDWSDMLQISTDN